MATTAKPFVIIAADDFGISRARTLGILDALENGICTSTSVMANATYGEEALRLAAERGLLNRVGLHLNLSEGIPLSDPTKIRSLLSPALHGVSSGIRTFLGKKGFIEACETNQIVPAEAAAEALQQIKWFTRITGHPPQHIDGHQHCHVRKSFCASLAEIFSRNGIHFTRIPSEYNSLQTLCPACSKIHTEAITARRIYKAAGISMSTCFVGLSFCGTSYTTTEFLAAIEKQIKIRKEDNEGGNETVIVEVMVHPGMCSHDNDAWDGFDSSIDRELELSILKDETLGKEMQARFELVSHAQAHSRSIINSNIK
eukprot:g4686.t1